MLFIKISHRVGLFKGALTTYAYWSYWSCQQDETVLYRRYLEIVT
jgi:hypothetical protein